MGLTLQDMRQMRTVDVANIVSEAADIRASDDEPSVREATQDDINWLKTI